MADFDLVGKVALKIEDAQLARLSAKINRMFAKGASPDRIAKELENGLVKAIHTADREAHRFVDNIKRDMAGVARVANKELTKAFDNVGRKASKSIKNAILEREKQSKSDKKLLDSIVGTSDKGQDQAIKKRIAIEKKDIADRKRAAREAADIDAQEVADSQAAFRKREAIARQEVNARVAARNKLAKEDEAEVRDSQRTFQTRERLAKQAVAARVREEEQELKAGQKAFEKREKFARDAVKARLKAQRSGGSGGGPPSPPRNDDPAFNFGRQSGLAFKRFAAFSLAAGSVFLVADAFRDAIKEAVDFEKQLVTLAQVSNSSVAALKDTRRTIDDLSTGLGVASKDLVESATVIRQAGFSIEETNSALDTLALTTLSPSFNNLKNTTEGLIALRSQFGTAANDYKKQFGEINAVSKAFAVESEDIITAIRKSGGAFKVAGGNVTELIALFTAVRATTRESADTIASGFRTIFARLQRPQIIDELKGFNIELRDVEGNFVGPLKAIEEINRALTDVGKSGDLQFARVAEQIGGIRQISKVVPLIQQFTTAQRAANVARLGANSLEEDAAIAQTSLANRITKTKEEFLKFGRALVINDQFKNITGFLLDLGTAFSKAAAEIGPLIPIFTAAFAIRNISSLPKFLLGFNSVVGGRRDFIKQRGFARGIEGNIPFLNKQNSRRAGLFLGASRPALAFGAGVGVSLLGSSIASNANPVNQRGRFVGGRGLEGIGLGVTSGALLGSAIPGVGTAVGAALGGTIGAIHGFTEALKDAQDALEESKFRPAFDALTQTLSEISAGRLSPVGRRDVLNAGLNALRERRLTATGVERDELRGNIRQTVESLLLFQQNLLDSSKTLEQFAAAGGDDAIKFIAENSVLTAKELQRQRDTALKNREREETLFKRVFAAQEALLQQSNLITAFGAALENATIKANDAAERFSFLASTAFGGGVGVKFRGTRGFGTDASDLGLKANSANQISSLIGLSQFKGLAAQTVAIQDIKNQLPAILSEFGVNRPIGATSEDLDTFVQKRLNLLTKNVPNKDFVVQPIIDAITDSISSQLSTQGSGQNEAIQKILSAPGKFIESVFSDTELTRIDELLKQAAGAFAERFNVFADQVAQITNNEISVRKELADNIQRQADITTEIARRRSPLQFPLGSLQAGRRGRAAALLGGNAGAVGGDAGNIIPFIRNARQIIQQREADLQQATSIREQKQLTEVIIKLQGEILAAGDAFDILVDKSDEIAAKFDEFDKIQLGRDQVKGGIKEFTFGGRDARNQLNIAAAAASIVSANPNLFFDPTVIPDTLKPVIGDFLDRLSEAPVFNGKKGRELSDIIQGIGLRNAGFPPDLIKQLLSNNPNARQEELLKQAGDLAREEGEKRTEFIRLQGENNKTLNEDIRKSLDDFIKDLRTNLLQNIVQSTQTRLGGVGVQQAELQKQAKQFGLIQSLGGSGINLDNKRVLDLAKIFRGTEDTPGINSIESFIRKSEETQKLPRNQRFGGLDKAFASTNSQFVRIQAILDETSENIKAAATKRGLNPNDAITDLTNRLVDASPSRALGTAGAVSKFAAEKIFSDFIDEQNNKARDVVRSKRKELQSGREKLSDQENNFLDTLINLPAGKFNELSTAINQLGDAARLDKVTEQLNKLNLESQGLIQTLEGLNKQIQALNGVKAPGGGIPANPAGVIGNVFSPEGLQTILQGITNGFSSFVNGSTPLAQALNSFPNSIEMQGNHTVNVNINGVQAMSQMQPAMEAFIQSEIAKALTEFTLKNLPGALSYSQ